MRILLGIVFWTLAALECLGLLFMLFVSVAAGPSMAENGDLAGALMSGVLLPLAAVIGAILLFALTRSIVPKLLALAVVLAPLVMIATARPGEMIHTQFEDSWANNFAAESEPLPPKPGAANDLQPGK